MKLKDLCIAMAAVWPIFSVSAWKVLCVLNGAADGNAGRTPGMYAASAAIGGIACCIVAAETYVPEPETYNRKKEFSTPKPPQVLMHKDPGGIIFGKYHGKYVETSDRIAHYLIIGQSGSGKSVLLISTLLTNFLGLNADGHRGKSRALFVLDLKGELSWKTSLYDGGSDRDKAPKILSIQKRSLSGYDMFYKLHRVKPATMQEIVETVSQIVNYLIPKPADVKDPFFINAGRNLICGLMIGKRNNGRTMTRINLFCRMRLGNY